MVQLSHLYITTGKNHSFDYVDLCWEVISLLFNTLFRFVIAFLWRSKHLLISWLHSPSAVILEPSKIKSVTVSIVSPFICQEVMGLNAMILVFWVLSFKPAFLLSSFTFMYWRRKWQPTPMFMSGESQGWGSLVGCHVWGRTESDTTEAT